MKHRIGTRSSGLARKQTDLIVSLWKRIDPEVEFRIVELSSAGDEMPDAPLDRIEGTGFFTSSLERALLAREIDLAVHSFKDLPVAEREGLVVAAVPPRGPVEDALCASNGRSLAKLRPGATVGTSSLRRTAQLRALRRDLNPRPVRGNVPTRLDKVTRGELDAVVLALAGLSRMGLVDRVTEVFPVERMLTAPAQGAIAVQVRAGDEELKRSLASIEDPATRYAAEAERSVLHELRGGCSVPVGAHARWDGTRIVLRAGVFAPAGDRALFAEAEGADPREVGILAARRLLEQGAGEILAALDREPRVSWERAS
jgi:hydroxymethylbilane synthase